MSRPTLFNSLKAGYELSDTKNSNFEDSLFYLHFDIIEEYQANVTALATITAIDSNTTLIRLDTILAGYITGGLFTGVDKNKVDHFKSLTSDQFKEYFEENFIIPVRNNKAEHMYYDNKDVYDSIRKAN